MFKFYTSRKNRSHELIFDKPAEDHEKSKLGRVSRTKIPEQSQVN